MNKVYDKVYEYFILKNFSKKTKVDWDEFSDYHSDNNIGILSDASEMLLKDWYRNKVATNFQNF